MARDRNLAAETPRFAGNQIIRFEQSGVTLQASRFRAGERIGPHTHDDPYVCVVIGGPLRERSGSRTTREGPLSVIMHPAGEEHDDYFEGAGLCVNLSIALAWTPAGLRGAGAWSDRRTFDAGPMLGLGLRLLRLHRDGLDGPSRLDLEEVAAEFVAAHECCGAERGVPARLRQLAERFDDDPSVTVGLAECARHVGLHPVYLARVFRRHFGVSLGEYQRQARLRHAVALLTRGDLSVSHVAADAGFVDQSHLTHALRRVTGFTPGRLRQVVDGRGPDGVAGSADTRRGAARPATLN